MFLATNNMPRTACALLGMSVQRMRREVCRRVTSMQCGVPCYIIM